MVVSLFHFRVLHPAPESESPRSVEVPFNVRIFANIALPS